MMQRPTVDRAELARLAQGTGADVPQTALEPLAVYLEMLCQWNRVMNLVGPRTWQDMLTRLAADSFHLAAFLEGQDLPPNPRVWDLGAGAGLPGIPLRMVWPRGTYHMVEAREKRALFVSSVLARLRLPATHIFRGSVERFFQDRGRQADCLVSRAFMPWRQLLALALEGLRPGGLLTVLALEPAPERVPAPWRLAAQHAYAVAGSRRWFWALCPDQGPDSAAGQAKSSGEEPCPR